MAENPDKNSHPPSETSDKVTLPTSFKRSFDHLALDYNDGDDRTRRHTDSSSSSSESQNSERAKRARSEGASDATGSSSSVAPSIAQGEDIDMVGAPGNEPLLASTSSPAIDLPADADDLTLALAHIPASAVAGQSSTGRSIGTPRLSSGQDVVGGITSSAISEDAFRVSMERYTAFDSHISALRNGTDAEGSETPPPSRRSVSISTHEQSIANGERSNDTNISSVTHWSSRSPSLSRMSSTEAALHRAFSPPVSGRASGFPPLPNSSSAIAQDLSDNSDVETDTVSILANIGSSILSRDRSENTGVPRESIGSHDIGHDLDISVDALMELASNSGRDDAIEPLQTATSASSVPGSSHRPSWGHPPSTLHDRIRRADEIIRFQLSATADGRGISQRPFSQLSHDASSASGESDFSANLAHPTLRPPSPMLYPHRSALPSTSVGSGYPANEHYTTSGSSNSGPAESAEASLYGNSSVQMLVEAARNELTQASRRQRNRLGRSQDEAEEQQTRHEASTRPMNYTSLSNVNPSPCPVNSTYVHTPPRYISRQSNHQLIPLPHPPLTRYHLSYHPTYSYRLSEDTRPYVPAFTSPGLEAGYPRLHSPSSSRTAGTDSGAVQSSNGVTQPSTPRQTSTVGTAPGTLSRAMSVPTTASSSPVQSSPPATRAEWDAAAQNLIHQLGALAPQLEMLLDSPLTPTIVRERIQRLADENGCLTAILPVIIERGRRSRTTVAAPATLPGPVQETVPANTADTSSGGPNNSGETVVVQSTISSLTSSPVTASNAPSSTESIASISNPTERLRALLSPPRGRARDASADRSSYGFDSANWEQQVMELSAYTLGLSADLRSHAIEPSTSGGTEAHTATAPASASTSNVNAHRVSPLSAPGVSPPRTARPVAIPLSVSTRNAQSDETRPGGSASTALTHGQPGIITTSLDHADNISSVTSFTGDTQPIGRQSVQLARSSSSAQVRDFLRRSAVPGTTVHSASSVSASNSSYSRAGQSFPASRSAESLQSHAQASGTFVTHPARDTQRSALQEEIDRLRSRLQVQHDSPYDFSPRTTTPIWDDSVSLWSPHHSSRQHRVDSPNDSTGAPPWHHGEASLMSPPQPRPPRVRRRARPDPPVVMVQDSEEEVEVLFAAGALGNSQDTSIMDQDSQDSMDIDDPSQRASSTDVLSSPERTRPQPEQNTIDMATDDIGSTRDRTHVTLEGVGTHNLGTTPPIARPHNSIGSTSPTRGINLSAYHDGPFRDTLARTRAYSRMRSRLDNDYRRAISASSPISRASTNTSRSEASGDYHDPARRTALPTAAFELEHRTAELQPQQSISNMARAVDYLQRITNPLRGGSTSGTGEASRRPTDSSPAHLPQSREKAPAYPSTTRTEVLNPNRARREAMERYREDNVLRELALETELAWMGGGGNARRDGHNPHRPLPVALPRGDRAPDNEFSRAVAERRHSRRIPHDNEWYRYPLPGDITAYNGLQALSSMIGGSRSRGTPDSVMNSLPSGTYGEWAIPGETEERCPICFDDYQASDPVLKLPNCAHWLHKPCLQQWLKSARTCPVCRARVESGQVGQTSGNPNARPFARSREHPWAGPPLTLRGQPLVEIRPPRRHPLTGRETVIPHTLARTSSTTRTPASSINRPNTASLASHNSGSSSSSAITSTTIGTSPTAAVGPSSLGYSISSPRRNPLNPTVAAADVRPTTTHRTSDHSQDESEGWWFFGGLEDLDNPWDN